MMKTILGAAFAAGLAETDCPINPAAADRVPSFTIFRLVNMILEPLPRYLRWLPPVH